MMQSLRRQLVQMSAWTAAAALCGCGGPPAEAPDLAAVIGSLPRPAHKIVLIGLDGADWNVAGPLMQQGQLPTLSALVAEGASGDLRSIPPMISPALWTTVVTGVTPERHGIHDFVFKEEGSYAQPIVTSALRRRLALWNVFSALGRKVGIVDWYATWPAEEVNGFIVSDRLRTMAPRDAGVVHSSAGIEDVLTDPPPLGRHTALERLTSGHAPLPEGLDKALREDLYRFRVAKELYRSRRPDFFAFYLKGLDAVGHFYWKYFEPSREAFGALDADEVRRLGSIIPDYYALCDALLGDFLRVVEADATVVVVSDHGFRAFSRPDSLIFDLDRLFEALGLLEFEDRAFAANRSERRVRMSGTRAYAHEGTEIVSPFGERQQPVYLNVAGRDPQGTIEAERWREARAAIQARLESLHTDLDTPVFAEVRIHDAAATAGGLQEPDLYVRVNRRIAFDYELLIEGRPYSLAEHFFWEYGNISGTHRELGIFVARGPMIRPAARLRSASLLDVAPTILHLAGAPVPSDLDGRVLREILSEPRRANPLVLASYESLIERRLPAVDTVPPEPEYRERLRALGYVQ